MVTFMSFVFNVEVCLVRPTTVKITWLWRVTQQSVKNVPMRLGLNLLFADVKFDQQFAFNTNQKHSYAA
jgi:hypothetical protein